MKKNNLAVIVLGPTGIGKTELALSLALSNGEIISVDSRQIYKYMDIGTAKPDIEQLKKLKHHLIDIITPDKRYSVAEFKKNAEDLIFSINEKGKIPFLVGGSGLYFKSIIHGLAEIPAIDINIKNYIENKIKKIGQERFYKILRRIDPVYADKIHPNDKQRTQRAIEVYYGTKKNMTDHLSGTNKREDIKFLIIGLRIERDDLYKRTDLRVDQMYTNGLVEEVKKLTEMGYTENDPGMNGIGYKEFLMHFKNIYDINKALYEMKKNTRHYVKRQFTWFNAMSDINWFNPGDTETIKDFVNKNLDNYTI